MKNKDNLIKKMFRDHGLESPSPGFTDNVMEQIKKSEELVSDRLLSPLQWVLISSGVVAAIITIIFLDFPFLENIFSIEKLSQIQFSGIGERLNNFAESFSGSMGFTSITIVIVAAVLMLLGIDRILRHRQDQVQVL